MIKKDVFYFKHDFSARNDPKMQKLLICEGIEGIGIYWCLIEILYEQGGYITIDDVEIYAAIMRTQSERITNIIQKYGLFQTDKNLFYSQRVLDELEARKGKSDTAKKAAESRWNANALPAQSKRKANAMLGEDRRRKEKKGEDIIKKQKFGSFQNVFLSADELEKLKERFEDYLDRIERLSEYIETRKPNYKNHYAVILTWARNDKGKGKDISPFSPAKFKGNVL